MSVDQALASFFILILVVVVLAATLLVALPGLLRWLASRNLQKRQQLIRRVRQLENKLQQATGHLEPYQALQAQQYRQKGDATHTYLQQAQANRQIIAGRWASHFPRVPAGGWPIQYFSRQPRDIASIISAFWRLRRLQAALRKAETALATAQQHLDQLDQMPAQLRTECEGLVTQSERVAALLQTERATGLVIPEPLAEQYAHLKAAADDVQRRLGAEMDLPLDLADQLGRTLTALKADLDALEGRATELRQERAALDKIAGETAEALAAVQSRLAAEPPEALAALLQTINTLLAEAFDLRCAAAFDSARALIDNGRQLIDLAGALITTGDQVHSLMANAEASLTLEALYNTGEQLTAIYRSLHTLLHQASSRQQLSPLPPPLNGALVALQPRLIAVQDEARQLQAQHRASQQQLERQANQAAHALARAWEEMQRVMRLAPGERLAQRYEASYQQRQAAKGKPRQLQEYVQQAAELAQDLKESSRYLQERLQVSGRLVQTLSPLTRETEQLAGQWRCLQPLISEIQTIVKAIEHLWQGITTTGWLEETYKRLDETKRLNQQLQERQETLADQYGRLERQARTVYGLMRYIQEDTSDLDLMKVERLIGLAEQRYQEAHNAEQCEEAERLLKQAEGYLNSLIM